MAHNWVEGLRDSHEKAGMPAEELGLYPEDNGEPWRA